MKVNRLRKCKKEKYCYYIITIYEFENTNNLKKIQTLICNNEKEAKITFDTIAKKYFYNKKEKCFTFKLKKQEKNIETENIENAFNEDIIMISTIKRKNEKIPYQYIIESEKENKYKLKITLTKVNKQYSNFYKVINRTYKDNGCKVCWIEGGNISVKNK